MKPGPLWLMLIFMGTAALSPCGAQTSDAIISPREKIELFDGRTLAGWTFVSKDTNATAAAIWSVTNGVILCQGKPYGYARTLKFYRDYQLHVEWRWPQGPGNSGVFLHLNPPDKVWPCCYEAQLLAGNAGELRLNGGSHIANLAPAVKSLPRQEASSEKPAGEWNAYDIICRSNTVTIRVNGVLQNRVAGTALASGTIGLQAEGAPVEFRNLVLEPLPGE
jgi:hypothetical protein